MSEASPLSKLSGSKPIDFSATRSRSCSRGWIVPALLASAVAFSCTKKAETEPRLRPLAPPEAAEPASAPPAGAAAATAPDAAAPAPSVLAPTKSDQGAYFDVSWDFNYINFPGKIVPYEVEPDRNYDLTETRVVALGKLPFTQKARMPFRMNSRGRTTLALVIENPTNEPWYFFANFHQVEPSKNGHGFMVVCLCANHLFEVPPNSAWYRIVALLGRRIVGHKRVSLRHDVVGMTKQEIERKRIQSAVSSAERE